MSVLNAIKDKKYPFILMGIVNATPDSFYDGGRYNNPHDSITYARKLIAEGADVLDVGGASSRPGAQCVEIKEEIQRVVPVIRSIRKESDIPISIDTTWAEVAKAAIDEGATWINDISAGRFDRKIAVLAGRLGIPVVLMHSRETPMTMQINPVYGNVIEEVIAELEESVKMFLQAGVERESIIIDPGIGFSKTFDQNCTLLKNIDILCQLGYPVLIGTSRKSFLEKITGRNVNDRLAGSLGSIASAFLKGVHIFRVHDVAPTLDFLKVLTCTTGIQVSVG